MRHVHSPGICLKQNTLFVLFVDYLTASILKIAINQAHLALAWLIRFRGQNANLGDENFPNSQPIRQEFPLSENQSIPESRQDILRFP